MNWEVHWQREFKHLFVQEIYHFEIDLCIFNENVNLITMKNVGMSLQIIFYGILSSGE